MEGEGEVTPGWFVVVADAEQGPVSSAELSELAADGRLLPTTLVRRADRAEAVPAGRVRGLFPEEEARGRRRGEPLLAPREPEPELRPLRIPGRLCVAGLSLSIVMAVCQAIAVGLALALLADHEAGREPSAHDLEGAQAMVAIGLFGRWIALFVGAGAFLPWLHRALANVRRMRTGVRASTGWAMAGWFVPFVNLVMPYLVVAEVWRKSGEAPLGRRPPTGLVLLWWLLYLGQRMALNVTVALLTDFLDLEELSPAGVRAARTALGAAMAEAGLVVVAALLAIAVVVQIGRWQDARIGEVR